MADQNDLYGADYEEQLFKQLAPAAEQRIRQTYANRGVKFGRAEGDINDALNKLRQEIALQVANKNAELKANLLLRKTAEDENVRKEQRAQSRDIENRAYSQTQKDRDKMDYMAYMDKAKKESRDKEFRDRYYKAVDAGYNPTEMSKFNTGSLPGQAGDRDFEPNYEAATRELYSDMGRQRSEAGPGMQDVNIYDTGEMTPQKSGFKAYQPTMQDAQEGSGLAAPDQGQEVGAFPSFDEWRKRQRGSL